MTESYISVGKLGKPHGIRGAFRFFLHRELKNKRKTPAHFLILQKGTYMPFFVKEVEFTDFDGGLISFEEITTPEKAKQYSGSQLFLNEKTTDKFFKQAAGDFDFIIGYKALNTENEELGVIYSVEENPGQLLVVLKREGEEFLVPLVDEFIIKTDKRKKQIVFSLPDGLLDL